MSDHEPSTTPTRTVGPTVPSAPVALPAPSKGRPRRGELNFAAPRVGKPPQHLADLDPAERKTAVEALGHKGFRARQLSTHYFERLVQSPQEMTDLPKAIREDLVARLLPQLLTPVRTLAADKGTTIKSVYRLHDGALVESVLMRYPRRVTICISSQAGCGMNCPFCATGQEGLTRNMSTAEIVEQVVHAARLLRHGTKVFGEMASGDLAVGSTSDGHTPDDAASDDTLSDDTLSDDVVSDAAEDEGSGEHGSDDVPGYPVRVSNVVFMGMGEALANYNAAIGAIRRMIDPAPDGLGMSARGITMSTVGLVPAMDKLTKEGIPLTLALSLHAPDDKLRDELVPINTRWSVDEAIDAAYRYFEATGRRVSIEYALIRGMNDQGWRADLLGAKLNARGRGWVHVNPIPLNPTPGSRWTASEPGVEREFVRRLRALGVPTTVRDTRGSDIDGACGQLAAATA